MSLGMPLSGSTDAASRAKRSSWSPSVSAEAKENQAGVGILFVEEEDPSGFVRVTVKALIEGGSAEKTGMVKSGDMVVRVGNQDVIGKPLSILRTMIPGPIGSYCRLGFLRGGVALNSNAVQEKSTYYDVQLLRQPPKNDKRTLVSGGSPDGANSDGSPSLYSSQNTLPKGTANSIDSFNRYGSDPQPAQPLSSSVRVQRSDLNSESIGDKSAHSPPPDRPPPLAPTTSPGGQQAVRTPVSPSQSGAPVGSATWSQTQKTSPPEQASPGYRPNTWNPQSPANKSPAQQAWQQGQNSGSAGSFGRQQSPPGAAPGLSQSYDQRSATFQPQSQGIQQPLSATTGLPQSTSGGVEAAKRPDVPGYQSQGSNNSLSTSVDAAINNVDRALYEMQSREIERLRAKLEASERDKKHLEDDLVGKGGKPSMPSSAPQQPLSQPLSSSALNDKRRIEMLEKQLQDLKQQKQTDEMKRLEAESALKVMERRVSDLLQNQQHRPMNISESARVHDLQEQLKVSEEKRREEEKKRAILEGKVRHLENQAKQNSPFRFQSMKTGKKGPPPHLPDISEGKEVTGMNATVIMGHSPQRSPTLGAIDGPVPDGMGPHGHMYGMHMQGGMPMTHHPNMQQNMQQNTQQNMQQNMQTNLYDSTGGMQNGLYSSLNARPPSVNNQMQGQPKGMAPQQGQMPYGQQGQQAKTPGQMPYGQQGQGMQPQQPQQGGYPPSYPPGMTHLAGQQQGQQTQQQQQPGMKAPMGMQGGQQANVTSPLGAQSMTSPLGSQGQPALGGGMMPGGRPGMVPQQGQMQNQIPQGSQASQSQQSQQQQPYLYGSMQNNRSVQQQPQQGYQGAQGFAPPQGAQSQQQYRNR
mmetsp:Transcript_68199/g.168525  ORF Transcript_68199/g.168525 Transcript_68199/m.168525 type:complete len:860 (-) Transcript_68199:250-2829(-)